MKYFIRWRHIPAELSFTPMMRISTERTELELENDNANDFDLQLAIANEFNWINPDSVRIESVEKY